MADYLIGWKNGWKKLMIYQINLKAALWVTENYFPVSWSKTKSIRHEKQFSNFSRPPIQIRKTEEILNKEPFLVISAENRRMKLLW